MEHLHQGSLGRPAFLPSCSDLLPFNHSVTLVSMNNTDDKPKVGRDWIAFVVAWIPYSLLTYRFWHNIDDAFISFRYAKNWAMGYGPRYNLGPPTGRGIQQLPMGSRVYVYRIPGTRHHFLGTDARFRLWALCSCTSFFERYGEISPWGFVWRSP